MKRAYILAAGTVIVLAGLSWAANLHLGDLERLPMQWGVDGRPTWFAPKWIGLCFGPGIGIFAMVSVLMARRYDRDGARAFRDLLPVSAIVIGGHIFYLYMLWKQTVAQSV